MGKRELKYGKIREALLIDIFVINYISFFISHKKYRLLYHNGNGILTMDNHIGTMCS